MFKFSTWLARLLPCCATETSDPSHTRALLNADHVGLLSASCCDPTALAKDAELSRNVAAALKQIDDTRPLIQSTITAAQAHLPLLQADANPAQQRLIQTIVALFQTHGLSIFPLLIIHGRVAFYGGVPSPDMISQALLATPAPTALER